MSGRISVLEEEKTTCAVVVGTTFSAVANCNEMKEHCAPSSNKTLPFILISPATTGATAVFKEQQVTSKECDVNQELHGMRLVTQESLVLSRCWWLHLGMLTTVVFTDPLHKLM